MAAIETSLDMEEEKVLLNISIGLDTFEVEKTIMVNASKLFKNITENDRSTTTIELVLPSNISDQKQTMMSMLEFVQYHSEHPSAPITKPLVSDNLLESGVCEWDNQFISKSDQELVNLSLIANYMDIPDLLALCCSKIGAIMKNIIKQYKTKDEQMAAVKARWKGTQQVGAATMTK